MSISRVDLYGNKYGYNKKKVKKKYKLKKKVKRFLIIFLLVFCLLIFISIIKPTNKTTNKEKVINKSTTKDNVSIYDEDKLNKLNNINKEIDYFNYDYIDRYISYLEKNNDLDIKQVIIDVNIGLDYDYYENSKLIDDAESYLVLVNKYNYLDSSYVPSDLEEINTIYALSNMSLRKKTKNAFEELSKDAKKENLNIIAMSTYRSYQYQVNLYSKYKSQDGNLVDTYAGRAGYSEHQSGLAVDVYNKKTTYTNFENTSEYNWMLENAYKYGFILRFPEGKEKYTGYSFESWHYRYVGVDAATKIHDENLSLEEYIATLPIKNS